MGEGKGAAAAHGNGTGGMRLLLRKERGYALLFGDLPGTRTHSHHVLELFIGIDGPVVVLASGTEYRGRLILLDSDQVHRARADRGGMAVAMIDPESPAARPLRAGILDRRSVAELSGIADWSSLVEALRDSRAAAGADASFPGAALVEERLSALFESLGAGLPAPEADPRIERMRGSLDCPEEREGRLGRFALRSMLSESRLSHLFKKEVGIPFRSYRLWLRLVDGLEAVLGGAGLTEAAHAAGFSDYAHFSRTFARMFGYTLASVFKGGRGIARAARAARRGRG